MRITFVSISQFKSKEQAIYYQNWRSLHYRYAEDERKLAPLLQRERLACSELVRQVKDYTGKIEMAGNLLLETLDAHLSDFSINLGNNQQFVTSHRSRLTMLCQMMLHHGNLIPETSENPERFQKFRPENRYYLCDSENERETIRKMQEERKEKTATRTRHLSDNAKALASIGSCTLGKSCTLTFGRKKSSDSNSVFYSEATLSKDTRPKQHHFKRSTSMRTKKISRANLYWTMEVDRQESPGVLRNEILSKFDHKVMIRLRRTCKLYPYIDRNTVP